jgi:hypothetical protein
MRSETEEEDYHARLNAAVNIRTVKWFSFEHRIHIINGLYDFTSNTVGPLYP